MGENTSKPPKLPSRKKAEQEHPFSPRTATSSPTFVSNTNQQFEEGTSKISSQRQRLDVWHFQGTYLYCTSSYNDQRLKEITDETCSSGDHNVVFSFPDGRAYAVARPVLKTSQSILSFTGAVNDNARIASVHHYDDDAPSFTSVIRFLAGLSVDLCPSRAPHIALCALRWKVPELYFASFAASEPLPLGDSSLPAWLSTVAHWLPILDQYHSSAFFPLPSRFSFLLNRRISLLIPHIVAVTAGCIRCSVIANPSQNFRRLSPACILCGRLEGNRSVWQALFKVNVLANSFKVGVRFGGPELTSQLFRVVLFRLKEEMPGTTETDLFLKKADWNCGWGIACQEYVTSIKNNLKLEDNRIFCIVSQTLSNAYNHKMMGGGLVGTANVRLENLSTLLRNDQFCISSHGGTWGPWDIKLKIRLELKSDNNKKSDLNSSLVGNISISKVGEIVGKEKEEALVRLKLQCYSGGCACHLGCAKGEKKDTHNDVSEWSLQHESKWGTLRHLGYNFELLSTTDLSEWNKFHHSQCCLYISASIEIIGAVSENLSGLLDYSVSEKESGSREFNCEKLSICSCKKCQIPTHAASPCHSK